MRRRMPLAALLGLAALIAPSSASAAAVADAGCPGPPDGTPLTPLGNAREAQTFTAEHTGALQRVTVAITNVVAGAPDFLVEILATDANGAPVNGALASATIPHGSVSSGPTTLDASLSPAAPVTAGQTYAVAISRPGASPLVPSWQIQTRTAAACPGSGFLSSGAGADWSPQPANADIIFQTYVDPAQVSKPGGGGAGFTLVNKHGRLFAKVPGPGRLVVDDAPRTARRAHKGRGRNLLKRTKARAKKAGLVPLRVELTSRAINRALRRRRLNIPAAVVYRPTGGQPSAITFTIRIRL